MQAYFILFVFSFLLFSVLDKRIIRRISILENIVYALICTIVVFFLR